ncbi:MAG: EAL domain-containing protein [Henriciella sp.]|nr:EAL domain-containing protein [Henriciella sp.]
MTPIRALTRSVARASFSNVLTLAAMALGLLLSGVFTVFYFSQSWNAYAQARHDGGVQISQMLGTVYADGKMPAIEMAMEGPLAGRAVLEDAQGNVISGTMAPDFADKATTFPLTHDGEALGTLTYATSTKYSPPLPYWLAVLVCLGISAISALIMRAFARSVGQSVDQATQLISNYSLAGTGRRRVTDFTFSEFRQLALETTKATRRVAKELENLRASARIDERTGLLTERAFHDEVRDTIQGLAPGGHAVLVTIEFEPQTPGADGANLNLATDAHAEVADRLRIFASQSAAKHGHFPDNWLLGSLFAEQYALLIKENVTRDETAAIIRELLGEFRIPLRFNQQTLPVSLRGSIVLMPQDGDSLSRVMDRGQATIEDLKQKSRTGFAFYSPKLERQRDAKLKLEAELRQAVAEDRFIPLFQPKIDLETGRISGTEALARWQLENGRLVSPSVFIELAEETGLISQIGEQIMRKACLETAKWAQEGFRVNLAVNVSPRQFENDNLAETILDALAKSGLPPRQFEIEITESLAIQQPERVRAVLEPLQRLGIKLAMDDFGTGHSNLAVLTQLDFDVFKIDRQFLTGTPHDPQANAIVDMILSMANSLEMKIVGEGIETEAQAEFLTKRQCDIGQGFLYSPPVTAQAFGEMLKSQPFMAKRLSA